MKKILPLLLIGILLVSGCASTTMPSSQATTTTVQEVAADTLQQSINTAESAQSDASLNESVDINPDLDEVTKAI